MVTITEETKKEYRELREILDELKVSEEIYHGMVVRGKQIIAQMANGVEQTTDKLEGFYPWLGQIMRNSAATYIANCDYMFRLLENYTVPEDNAATFKHDRLELLKALRHDILVKKKG